MQRRRCCYQKLIYVLCVWVITTMLLTACDTHDAYIVKEPSQMPDIVFLNRIDYSQVAEEGQIRCAITFYDKNGQYYTSSDAEVCSLHTDELIKAYAAGELKEKVEFHTTCSVDELFENYQKLCELREDESLEIVTPQMKPAVQTIVETWYGICYDNNGALQLIKIHEKDAGGNMDANDARANEIYQWYVGTFR